MENQLITLAPKGSLAAVGATTKAFIVAHSVSLALGSGLVFGVGAYYMTNRYFSKRKARRTTSENIAASA